MKNKPERFSSFLACFWPLSYALFMKKLILISLILMGCQTRYFTPRVAFNAKSFGDFIITNAGTNTRNSMVKLKDKRTYSIKHEYLIKNDSSKVQKLDLSKKEVLIQNEKKDISCNFTEREKLSISLKPKEMIRLLCHFIVKANKENMLEDKDSTARIQLTLNKNLIEFEHIFYRRDFYEKN